jgi:hypothetical protein
MVANLVEAMKICKYIGTTSNRGIHYKRHNGHSGTDMEMLNTCLFGHSIGGLIAYELVRECMIQSIGCQHIVSLVVSDCLSPEVSVSVGVGSRILITIRHNTVEINK